MGAAALPLSGAMRLIQHADGFDLLAGAQRLLRHRSEQPCFFVGSGEASVRMNKGHFKISDYVTRRIPLAFAAVARINAGWQIDFAPLPGAPAALRIIIDADATSLQMRFTALDVAV